MCLLDFDDLEFEEQFEAIRKKIIAAKSQIDKQVFIDFTNQLQQCKTMAELEELEKRIDLQTG